MITDHEIYLWANQTPNIPQYLIGGICFRNSGYHKNLIVFSWELFGGIQMSQARLVSSWVFKLDSVSPKYDPSLDQTRLVCHRGVPIRYDKVVMGATYIFTYIVHISWLANCIKLIENYEVESTIISKLKSENKRKDRLLRMNEWHLIFTKVKSFQFKATTL